MDNKRDHTIRRLVMEDLSDFRRLWKIHFGEEAVSTREQIFKWILKGNPFSTTHDDYFVASGTEGVIGYHGSLPFRFSLSGRDVDASVHTDALVDPSCRGQGVLGSLLIEMGMNDRPFSIALWFNRNSSKIYERFGWRSIKNIDHYVRVYDAAPFVRQRLGSPYRLLSIVLNGFIQAIYWLQKSLHENEPDGLEVQEVDSFDERFDKLFHEVKWLYHCIGYRTSDVLAWRYAEKPNTSYRKIICLESDVLKGFLIYQEQVRLDGSKRAIINDFLCSPYRADVFMALLSKAIKELEKERPVCIEILSSHQAFSGVLKKFLFIPTGENDLALKVKNIRLGEGPCVTDDGRKWFFTYGDGDWSCWSE